MEPKFINKYVITFELFKEWANNPVGKTAIQNRRKGIRLRVSEFIISILIIALGILLNEFFFILIGAALSIIYTQRLFFLTNKVLKKKFDNFLKIYDYNQWTRTNTFSDKIIIEDGRSTTQYEYSEMLKVTEDEDYFFLFKNADLVFRIRKDSFTLGSPDDFREFINSVVTNKAEPIEMEEDDLNL